MATGSSIKQPSQQVPAASPASAYDQVIDQKIDRTRAQIKLVDLFSTLMVLVTGILAFLLVLSVIDAWVFELGTVLRLLALVTLVGAMLYYGVRRIMPLALQSINPAYAAKVIEESEPSLKNSLLNFLSFKRRSQRVPQPVYHALQQRAATDLTHVSVETAVDRARLIKIGYIMAAVVVACGLYKVLSPKDPLQTIARVAAPFAELSRPSRARIVEVQPGDTHVYYGESLTVQTQIRGVSTDRTVYLYYTTEDRQSVQAAIPMTWDDGGFRCEAELTTGRTGIQQNLKYWIAVDDARSREFQVLVRTMPTIAVESLQYDYPDYTGLPDKTVEGQGEIDAPEGTQVTWETSANVPIDFGHVELLTLP